MSETSVVQVETVTVADVSGRQIAPRVKVSELLADRAADIEAAISETVNVVRKSMEGTATDSGIKISKLEASFGVKLKADAGAVLTRIGGECSLEFKITIERK